MGQDLPLGERRAEAASSTTIGVTGQRWRASVSAWGGITVDGGVEAAGSTLDWHVAADDRWHDPAAEVSVRQRRIGGTPVVETRLRVPRGDAVQRVWAVPDLGGLVLVEVENDSPMPIAVALSGAPVTTARPASDVPARGIDLPPGATVLPVGHHATVRAALTPGPVPSGSGAPGAALVRLPGPSTVARGWATLVDRASRLRLPDEALVEAVIAARCDVLLGGPVPADEDDVGHLLDVAELVRLGEDAERWLVQVVPTLEGLARRPGAAADVALQAVERVAVAAGDGRAAADIGRLRRARRRHGRADDGPGGPASLAELRRVGSPGRFVHQVERWLADHGALLPHGIPASWFGADLEAHGLPSGSGGTGGTVSFAIRWHGARPAVLWEQHGETVELRAPVLAPRWASRERVGEALWPAPSRPAPRSVGPVVQGRPAEPPGPPVA